MKEKIEIEIEEINLLFKLVVFLIGFNMFYLGVML